MRLKLNRKIAPIAVSVLLLFFSACSGPELPLAKLAADFEPLRADFNRDAGKVRLVLLLDPT